MINFTFEEDVQPVKYNFTKLRKWIKSVAADYDKQVGNVCYLFCNDERILEVNRQYLQHDYYTDIITFDYCEDNIISGDMFISLDTVRSNAEQYGEDFQQEFLRVVIHGILHLCGQDDKTDETQEEMTRKENLALAKLT